MDKNTVVDDRDDVHVVFTGILFNHMYKILLYEMKEVFGKFFVFHRIVETRDTVNFTFMLLYSACCAQWWSNGGQITQTLETKLRRCRLHGIYNDRRKNN